MKTRQHLITGMILGLSALAPQAYADQGMPPMPPMDFADPATAPVDTNGDGKISAAEITAARSAEFSTIDSDSSGGITLTELDAYANSRQAAKLASLDTDSSGQLSLTEFVGSQTGDIANLMTEVFHLADSDNSGSLSAAEFGWLSPGIGGVIRHFAMLDQDYNLILSQDEYLAPPKKPGHGKMPNDNTGANTGSDSNSNTNTGPDAGNNNKPPKFGGGRR